METMSEDLPEDQRDALQGASYLLEDQIKRLQALSDDLDGVSIAKTEKAGP